MDAEAMWTDYITATGALSIGRAMGSYASEAIAEVGERFAWDEGEGDRTLTWWRQAHLDYFAATGTTPTHDTMMVLERFELVWPP